MLVDLDEQATVRQGLSSPGDAAVQALQLERATATGQAHAITHFGDRSDRRKLILVPRHEQNALFVAGVDRQRERHAREDDDVIQRDQKKATHQVFTFDRYLLNMSRGYHPARRAANRISVQATEIIRVVPCDGAGLTAA